MQYDVIIVGAGPAGMALAKSLTGTGLSVAILEKRDQPSVADPAFDGREIALTHRSIAILKAIDAWRHVPAEIPAEMREARVLNGGSPYALRFDATTHPSGSLGCLVPNHLLRRALYRTVADEPDITMLYGRGVTQVTTLANHATVRLEDNQTLTASLVIAADTRFSETRRRQGIATVMHDFGKMMLVSAVTHDEPHEHVATEWFEHGHTIAMLPMQGNRSSAVLTDTAAATEAMLAMDNDAFGAEVTRRYRGRLGPMQLDSTRHAYPLIATYATRFVRHRFALVGDAAVGMHPVTAQGFNFGLQGQDTLAKILRRIVSRGGDIGAAAPLHEYEMKHRAATLPLWLATNAIARLYVDDRMPARLVRGATLRVGGSLPLVRRAIVSHLTRNTSAPVRLPTRRATPLATSH
jgi:ubiquinone biosynthesis UbiH/UbiF/VisC/COQ6 family hydroxylase